MIACPYCTRELVEVDNPMRREVRHRRGEEALCPGPPDRDPGDELTSLPASTSLGPWDCPMIGDHEWSALPSDYSDEPLFDHLAPTPWWGRWMDYLDGHPHVVGSLIPLAFLGVVGLVWLVVWLIVAAVTS